MKIAKSLFYLIILNALLWMYSERIFGLQSDFTSLICLWTKDFDKFDTMCIHWITMRISIWLYVLWKTLWLEQSFMLYLFVRERNYKKMFAKQYKKCVLGTVIYFGIQILVFAVLFIWNGNKVSSVLQCFFRVELWVVIINEVIGVLNLCLSIYLIYCVTRRIEISFLAVLGARLLLGFIIGSMAKYMYAKLFFNIVFIVILLAGVIDYAGAKFYDRIQGDT